MRLAAKASKKEANSSPNSTDTWGKGRQSRKAAVQLMRGKQKVYYSKSHIGFGKDADSPHVFNKELLAKQAGCNKEDRCWLVGLSEAETFSERAKMCTHDYCKEANSPRHSFPKGFRKLVMAAK
jgi:hypothetical protein